MIALPADLPGWLRLWCDGLLRASWEGGIALGLAWAACRLFPRLSATARCWLWRLAYLKLLIALLIPVPIPVPVLPAGRLPVEQARYYADAAGPAAPASPVPALPVPPAATASFGDWGVVVTALFALWSAGVLWSLVLLLREWREAGRLHRSCRPAEGTWIEERCAELAFLFHLRRPPRILVADGRGSPLLVGMGGPAVLLPTALLRDYAPEEVELMLAHELAHLKRGDLAWSWLPALAHALFFFHPLVRLASREWRLAQEMACDEIVLEVTTAPAAEYGQVLVRVASHSRLNLGGALATVGLEETPDTLKRRLSAMKHPPGLSPISLGAFSMPVMLLGVTALLPWKLAAADGSVTGPPLHYGWQPGRAYSYQVVLEADHPDYQERHTGAVAIRVRQEGQTLSLAATGSFFAHRIPNSPAGLRAPLAPQMPLAGLGFRGGGGDQVRIDPRGRIYELRAGTLLPYSFGPLGRMVIDPLPDGPASAWEASGEREILLEEEADPFPAAGPRFFGPQAPAGLAGRESARYAVEGAGSDAVVIRKQYELRTVEEYDGAPRLRLAVEGRLTWDVRLGIPRNVELRGTLTQASVNLVRRTPLSFRWELQDTPPASAGAKPASDRPGFTRPPEGGRKRAPVTGRSTDAALQGNPRLLVEQA